MAGTGQLVGGGMVAPWNNAAVAVMLQRRFLAQKYFHSIFLGEKSKLLSGVYRHFFLCVHGFSFLYYVYNFKSLGFSPHSDAGVLGIQEPAGL